MNKEKRKTQPINMRYSWLRYSLLAILLLIPFRIAGNWLLTTIIYVTIFLVLVFILIRFVRRYAWRRWIVILMLVCALLPIAQLELMWSYGTPPTRCIHEYQGILRLTTCTDAHCTGHNVRDYIGYRGMPFSVAMDSGPSNVLMHCPFNLSISK